MFIYNSAIWQYKLTSITVINISFHSKASFNCNCISIRRYCIPLFNSYIASLYCYIFIHLYGCINIDIFYTSDKCILNNIFNCLIIIFCKIISNFTTFRNNRFSTYTYTSCNHISRNIQITCLLVVSNLIRLITVIPFFCYNIYILLFSVNRNCYIIWLRYKRIISILTVHIKLTFKFFANHIVIYLYAFLFPAQYRARDASEP